MNFSTILSLPYSYSDKGFNPACNYSDKAFSSKFCFNRNNKIVFQNN